MKISVIIPTYKPKDYLWECLNSLVNQSFSQDDFEVIIVLNGCSEPWKSQIEDYIASNMSAMNVTFIQTDIPGVSNARNLGLDAIKGDYVVFIDDDDYISNTCLQEMLNLQNGNVVVTSYPYAFNDWDSLLKQQNYYLTDAYEYCIRNNCKNLNSTARKFFSSSCMKLIPSSFIGKNRFDTRFRNGEDSLFMFLISDRIKEIKFAGRDAVYYRRYRLGSAVTTKRSKREVIRNCMLQICVYFEYFFMRPFAYNWTFFSTRIIAALKHVIVNCL